MSDTPAAVLVSDAPEDELDSSTTEGYVEHLPLRIKVTLPLHFYRSATSTASSTPALQLSVQPARGGTVGRKRKQSESSDVDKALLLRLQMLQQQQDGEAAFGEHVAASLRQLNSRERAIARHEIDNILFKVQFAED